MDINPSNPPDLDALIDSARSYYQDAWDAGMRLEDMANATGMPVSFFSMWLRGYRPIARTVPLRRVLAGMPKVESMMLMR